MAEKTVKQIKEEILAACRGDGEETIKSLLDEMEEILLGNRDELDGHYYEIGKIAMIEELSIAFSEKSGKFYANNEDSMAKTYRILSNELTVTAKARREDLDKKEGRIVKK